MTSMNPPPQRAVHLLASILIISGCIAAVRTVIILARADEILPHLLRGLGVVMVPIGLGLLRFKPAARVAALIWFAILLIHVVNVFLTLLSSRKPTGHEGSPLITAAFAVAVLALAIWGYRTLTRPSISALFAPAR